MGMTFALSNVPFGITWSPIIMHACRHVRAHTHTRILNARAGTHGWKATPFRLEKLHRQAGDGERVGRIEVSLQQWSFINFKCLLVSK